MSFQKLIPTLTYLGAIPFVVSASCIALNIAPIGIDAHHSFPAWEMILLTYGAIILSFLGGMHWGIALSKPDVHGALTRALWSNAISLFAWLTLLIPSTWIALSIQCFLFIILWLSDIHFARHKILPIWFAKSCCCNNLTNAMKHL